MKRKFLFLLTLVAALSFSSCMKEIEAPTVQSATILEDGRALVKMTFGVSSPSNVESPVRTKSSIPQTTTSLVSRISMFAVSDGVFDESASVVDVVPSEFAAAFVPGKTYDLYFIANIDSETANSFLTKLRNMKVDSSGKAFWQSFKYRINDYNNLSTIGLPMTATYKNWVCGTSDTHFYLDKLVSTYIFTANTDLLRNLNITFKSMRIRQASNVIMPFYEASSAQNVSTDIINTVNLADQATAEDIEKLNNGEPVVLYMFENMQGNCCEDVANTDPKKKFPDTKHKGLCTYLEVEAEVYSQTMHAETVKYRTYLGGTPSTFANNFDIKRNTEYKLELEFVKDTMDGEEWRIDNGGNVEVVKELVLSKTELNLMLDIPDTLDVYMKDKNGTPIPACELELDVTELKRHNPYLQIYKSIVKKRVEGRDIDCTRYIFNAWAETCDDRDYSCEDTWNENNLYYGHAENRWMDPTVYDLYDKLLKGYVLTEEEGIRFVEGDYFGRWVGQVDSNYNPEFTTFSNYGKLFHPDHENWRFNGHKIDGIKHNTYSISISSIDNYNGKPTLTKSIQLTKWNQYFPIEFCMSGNYLYVDMVNPFKWTYQINITGNYERVNGYKEKKNIFGKGISGEFTKDTRNNISICVNKDITPSLDLGINYPTPSGERVKFDVYTPGTKAFGGFDHHQGIITVSFNSKNNNAIDYSYIVNERRKDTSDENIFFEVKNISDFYDKDSGYYYMIIAGTYAHEEELPYSIFGPASGIVRPYNLDFVYRMCNSTCNYYPIETSEKNTNTKQKNRHTKIQYTGKVLYKDHDICYSGDGYDVHQTYAGYTNKYSKSGLQAYRYIPLYVSKSIENSYLRDIPASSFRDAVYGINGGCQYIKLKSTKYDYEVYLDTFDYKLYINGIEYR